MAHIGTFIRDDGGFSGLLHTLARSVQLKLVPTTSGTPGTPDYRVLAHNTFEVGAAWKRISKAERPYLSVTLDDPSFPAPVYASLVEDGTGAFNLLWSRGKTN